MDRSVELKLEKTKIGVDEITLISRAMLFKEIYALIVSTTDFITGAKHTNWSPWMAVSASGIGFWASRMASFYLPPTDKQ